MVPEKATGIHKETIYTCYVTDRRRLIGIVSAKDLMTSDDDMLIRDLMEKEIISIINTHADDDGWVDLSELGDNLPKRVPGFDPRNYKCTKLKQFIERFDSVEVRSARNPHNKILSIIYVRVKQKEEKPVLSKVRRGGKRKKDADAEEE